MYDLIQVRREPGGVRLQLRTADGGRAEDFIYELSGPLDDLAGRVRRLYGARRVEVVERFDNERNGRCLL